MENRLAVSGFGSVILDTARRFTESFDVRARYRSDFQYKPGRFLVAAGDQVHEVDSESGGANLVQSGLTLRKSFPMWPLGLGFLIWGAFWTLVYWRIHKRTSEDGRIVERFAWIVVMATALLTILHWGLLLGVVSGNGRSVDPASFLCCLSFCWLPASAIIVVSCIKWGKGPIGRQFDVLPCRLGGQCSSQSCFHLSLDEMAHHREPHERPEFETFKTRPLTRLGSCTSVFWRTGKNLSTRRDRPLQ